MNSLDPAAPSVARALLRESGLRPRKRLGQHFLVDGNTLDRIARIALPSRDVPVVEIGAGLGALTRRLAERASRVTAVEVDDAFRPILSRTLGHMRSVDLVFADILSLQMSEFLEQAFGSTRGIVAGNIPYNITSPILERLLEHCNRIERIALLVQREVASRLAAEPGTKDYGSLTVFAQFHAAVRHHGYVPAHLFHPPPDVGSAIVTLEPHASPPCVPENADIFRAVVRAAFGYRRKTIANALAQAGLVADSATAASLLMSAGIEPTRRGETLSLSEFGRLSDTVNAWEPNR